MSQIMIHNGTLINGRFPQPIPDAAVLIEDNKILNAGPAEIVQKPGEETHIIDAQGGTILPGLIDTHVHIMIEGVNIARDIMAPFSLRFYQSVDHMQRTLNAGITSVRDAGGADLGLKQAVESRLVAGPRLQISINALTITGGHGDGWMPSGSEFTIFPPHPGLPDGRCDGRGGVRRKVREMLRAGADIIKIHATGGVLSPTDHPQYTQFSPEELAIIVQEAAFHRGKKVMAHAQGAEGIKNAVRAGIHTIEHGIFLDDEGIDLMLEHGTILVPTLLAPIGVLEAGAEGGMPEYGLRKSREVIDAHKENTHRAYEAGVKIAMGTDAAVMPHGTNLRELGLLVEIGMSPMEAIKSATATAAECLGWQDRLGTIEAGKLADLIICKGDPLVDIHMLENNDNIKVVIQDGRIVKQKLSSE
ncbi:MAG: amidohydrolase family protein [Candidatus Promineifilaceae bacterium]|nr:amidohydrolase family protein [Candidatus Promineifilaceae bacterium]